MNEREEKLSRKKRAHLVGFVVVVAVLAVCPQAPAAGFQSEEAKTTGWVCGQVRDESGGVIAGAGLTLLPKIEGGASESASAAEVASDEHGSFCIRDLSPGFYELLVAHPSWPPQPPRPVETRAGLVNRLTPPMELELEPGEPRVSFEESFDGMSAGAGRALMERLLQQADTASVRELARRLLPKRGVTIQLNRLILGLNTRPLLDEVLRQLDRGYLPPLKTARYVFLAGELGDPRTREVVVPALLEKLRDARTLPAGPTGRFGEDANPVYVSDIAIQALARFAGKDFNWSYGKPPFQNERAMANARDWWRNELEKQTEKNQ